MKSDRRRASAMPMHGDAPLRMRAGAFFMSIICPRARLLLRVLQIIEINLWPCSNGACTIELACTPAACLHGAQSV